MAFWLMAKRSGQAEGVLTRFDPRFWSVDFPRPMMAAVVASGADALRVTCAFHRRDDLAGLIWEAEDRHDHPLLAYQTARDFRECRLSFRWRSGGIRPLDAVHGPVLTIEGRDASGAARAWYVRLWNYAVGTPEDAQVAIDFARVDGGFLLPGEADPVWAGDVDRMFISLVAPGYDGSDGWLDAPAEGWAELSDIACEGPGSVLGIGDAVLPEHGLRIAGGYDDQYHLTPQRLLRQLLHLGYRGSIVHYVGMSHYFRLARSGERLEVSEGGGVLNAACAAWHGAFVHEAAALGYSLIWSLSYELFDAHCPEAWKQRDADGNPALTGWVPPSTLLSPASEAAMAYLQAVARAFAGIAQPHGRVRFQVGEPWWWTFADGRICLYDPAAREALAPAVAIPSLHAPLDAGQCALLDRAGALLARSTAALGAAVRDVADDAELLLLAYLPTVLDARAPEAMRANLPVGWAAPAFDVLQLEDYDWAAAGAEGLTALGIAAAEARLGYPAERQHYFAGFVLRPEDRHQWHGIARAADTARRRGVETFVWAVPQVLRDGFIHHDEEDAMDAFDDVLFPLSLGREAEVAPEVSTQVLTGAGGQERRQADWAGSRTRYDVGPGVRSDADIALLLGFFRARMGPARGFRLRDPFDHRSNDAGAPEPTDQAIGTGDGVQTVFALTKAYGAVARRITRPVAGSVRVAVDAREVAGFTLLPGGRVALDTAPPPGAPVSAGFLFDVPVRFAEDRLAVTRATHGAGAAPSVPLVEIKEEA